MPARRVRAMHFAFVVARRMIMLLGVVLLPGGLVALLAAVVLCLLARSARGERMLRRVRRHLPPSLVDLFHLDLPSRVPGGGAGRSVVGGAG